MEATGGSERKVNRKQRLRIQAKTWNDMIDVMRAAKRDRGFVGATENPTFATDPNSTVLVQNKSTQNIGAFRVLRIKDVAYTPANNGHLFNQRPILNGDVPNDSDNAFIVTKVPIEKDRISIGVIHGLCVCRVKINDESHDWAKPVDGQTYLESATEGQARLLWYGVKTESGESGGSGGSESGDEDTDVYLAVVDLIGSIDKVKLCGDKYLVDYSDNVGGGVVSADDASTSEFFTSFPTSSRNSDIKTIVYHSTRSGSGSGAGSIETAACIKANSGINLIDFGAKSYTGFFPPSTIFTGAKQHKLDVHFRIIPITQEGIPTTYTDGNDLDITAFSPWIPLSHCQYVWIDGVLVEIQNDLATSGTVGAGLSTWIGASAGHRRTIKAGDTDGLLGFQVRYVFYTDGTNVSSVGTLWSLMTAGLTDFGNGGTYISVEPREISCIECIETMDSGDDASVIESGVTEDMCCTLELLAHPDLQTDDAHVSTFSWSGAEWTSVTDGGEKLILSCSDGVWTAYNHDDHTIFTVGTDVTCGPFSVTIDTDAILNTGYGLVTMTIA